MSSVATINPDSVSVQPGGEAECELRVRNTGRIVDQFSFEALGDAAPWTTFEPSSVSLFPDAEGTTRLVFRPPRAPDTPAGPCPVGVRIRSTEDPGAAVVEEVTLDVGRLADTFAELIPRTGRGSRRAAFHLAVDNRGNSRLNANLSASDPDDRLRYSFDPPSIVAEPGTAAFAKVVARPLKRFLRGQAISHPFQVRVEPEGEAALAVEGTMLQEALLPKWVPRALIGLVVAGWACVVLWALLLKPTVKTTAREAANDALVEPLREASKQMAAIAAKVGLPPPPPLVPGGKGGGATTTTTTVPAAVAAAAAAAPVAAPAASNAATDLGTPYDGRLEVTPDAQTVSYTVPDGRVFSLTDIFLQNPEGDSGRLRVQRGKTTILSLRLENFRDLDYHFVSPLVFSGGQTLTLAVDCANGAAATATTTAASSTTTTKPKACTPAATFNGFLRPA
jgi:hypothetical protein